jgi:predicted nucleotide-binding protein
MSVDVYLDRARKVFVVHGRNGAARTAMFAFLRAIGLDPIEWSEAVKMTGEGSPYIGQVLDTAFNAAQAIVVLLTPDDVAYMRTEYASSEDDPDMEPLAQARPNVLFEAGMAMGRDAKRTVLVEFGKLRPFSDVAGGATIRRAVRSCLRWARGRGLIGELTVLPCSSTLQHS